MLFFFFLLLFAKVKSTPSPKPNTGVWQKRNIHRASPRKNGPICLKVNACPVGCLNSGKVIIGQLIHIISALQSHLKTWIENCQPVLIWIYLFHNHILFIKYLSPLIWHRNSSVFNIHRWISVFRREKQD